MQLKQPVMSGRDRAVAWISGFTAVGAIGLAACLVTCSVRNHAADSARIAACSAAVAAHNGDVSKCDAAHIEAQRAPVAPDPQCSGNQQSYRCCVEHEQAQSLHCWR